MKMLLRGSGKGGVGKSTLSVSFAILLQNLGLKVGLIDADIYGPSLNEMLQAQELPREESGLLKPASCNGIEFISLAHFPKFKQGAFFRAPMINSIIDQFLTKVNWSQRDVIIIDLPPGTGDIQLTILQKLKDPLAVLVTTPQQISYIDVEKAIYLFKKLNVEIMGIVENMSYYQDALSGEKIEIFGAGAGVRLSQKFQIPLLGKVPIDPHLLQSLDSGKGASFINSYDELFKIAVEISNQLCDYENKEHEVITYLISPQELLLQNGDKKVLLSASEIQNNCPCARCEDRILDRSDITILKFERVANFALKFKFSKGCDRGIYTWEQLFEISNVSK
jgi:ATP-binding protein involved in chromosome partitioning